MSRPSSERPAAARIWQIPAVLAGSTLAGLLLALTGGAQPWRAIAWGLLALPLVVGLLGWSGWGRRSPD